jgi:hypothetical protein
MVKAAAMMTQRLGFKVTNHNIKDAINQGIVNWKRPYERSAVSSKDGSRVEGSTRRRDWTSGNRQGQYQ